MFLIKIATNYIYPRAKPGIFFSTHARRGIKYIRENCGGKTEKIMEDTQNLGGHKDAILKIVEDTQRKSAQTQDIVTR